MISKFINKIFGKKEEKSSNVFDFDLMHKQTFVHLESAYRHQNISFRRASEDDRITLGEVIVKLFTDVKKSEVLSMAIMYRLAMADNKETQEVIIEDVDNIWNYDLFSCILKNKDEEGHYTLGMYHETTLVVKCTSQNIILTLTSLGGIDTLKYMRVTLLSPSANISDDGHSFVGPPSQSSKSQNIPSYLSFILSYNEVENNSEFNYFETVERSCIDKHDKGKDHELDEVEKEYVHGKFENHPYYHYLGYGQWLFKQERYYDAFSNLDRFYNFIKSCDALDDEYLSDYYTACNMMGQCLLKMGRNDEAAHYFRQGSPGISSQMPNYLTLAYAKLGNPIAISQLYKWTNGIRTAYGAIEDWPEGLELFCEDVHKELIEYKKKMDELISSEPSYNGAITVGYVLERLMDIKQNNLAPCMFVYDLGNNRFLSKVEDENAISNYLLNTKEAINKVFVLSCTFAHYLSHDEVDKSILCYNAPIVIATHAVSVKGCSSIMRVDIVRSNFVSDDDKREQMEFNLPIVKTFCLGECTEMNYFANKESLLEAIRKSIEYKDEMKFVESLKLAKWVFECTLNLMKDKEGLKFESNDELLRDILFEAAFNVGYSLMELGNTATASYYLDLARYSMQYEHIQEYINFLANTKDSQALEVVDEVIEHSPKPEDEDGIGDWNDHMAFLKRRKAYILIDKQQYKEAKQLLKEMRKDPLCKDFAEGELNYLNAIENN